MPEDNKLHNHRRERATELTLMIVISWYALCVLAIATSDLVLSGSGCEYYRLWHLELVVAFGMQRR
jgi:hypothetical protein